MTTTGNIEVTAGWDGLGDVAGDGLPKEGVGGEKRRGPGRPRKIAAGDGAKDGAKEGREVDNAADKANASNAANATHAAKLTSIGIPCSRDYHRRIREHCRDIRVSVPYFFDGLVVKDFEAKGLEPLPDRVPERERKGGGAKGEKGVDK